MSVLVFAENWDGKFKNPSFEAVSYGKAVADKAGTDLIAVTFGNLEDDASVLGKYGANKVVHVSDAGAFDAHLYGNSLKDLANGLSAKVVVVSQSNNGKMLSSFLAVAWEAGMISNVVEAPESVAPIKVKKKVFSSKGIATVESSEERVVLALASNSFGAHEAATDAAVESGSTSGEAKTQSVEVDRATGQITLSEAEVVVSAGRGLKGPENWGMVEELAGLLGAATACSKPVSDVGWRPHTEHVGQTGKAIAPNLYIAIGISGAIQHLAGVSSSKVIVVVNSDPEAPFFKAADYGIVGDAFDVVPRLIEAVKELKG